MDFSEDLDLDSLMELLDDNESFEEELPKTPTSINASTSNHKLGDTDGSPEKKFKTGLILSETDLFSPQRSENLSSRKKTSSVNELKQENAKSPVEKRSKTLKDVFRKNLSPKKVENPKANTVFDLPPTSSRKDSILFNFGEMDSSDEENKDGLTETGKSIKKEIKQTVNRSSFQHKGFSTSTQHKGFSTSTWKSAAKPNNAFKDTVAANSFVVDSYSGIRIINPLVSFSTMQQRMEGRRMIKMSFMQNCIKGGDIEGDWVTMGVLLSKTPPKTSKNGKTFSIWKMSDLHDPENTVSVFLFKTAHTEHWKTTIGTVIGILNASILSDKDKYGNVSISVDQPGKFMLMGKSKDLGFCKSKRKDGTPCNVAINVFQCEYCLFHVKKEYKNFSGKRSELQASYNGREPSLKNRLLKGKNVFYGGQSFTASEKKPSSQIKSKDKLTLSNLGLKRKATDAIETVEREKGVRKLTEMYGPEISKAAESNSEFINQQLIIPTAGSRNLLQHLMKEKSSKGEPVKVISPKELLRLRDSQANARGVLQKKRNDSLTLKSLTPQLGRGLQPGQDVSLDFSSPKVSSISNSQDYAKIKAIQKIKEKGPLKPPNPNSVKVSLKSADKVKTVLEKSFEEKKDLVEKEETSVIKSKLGNIDLKSDKVKEILNRKSSHAYEIEMAEMEKEAAYFNALEKKERMEEKMASTTEIVCDVVSCKKCKYTSHTATDRCKQEQHPLKCHRAVKRFFACKGCKRRTFGFTKFITRPCRNCGSSNFERTSMMKPRSGPKLDSETLSIRGDEINFLSQMANGKF